MDIVSQIIEFEDGELDEENAVALFSELIKTGLAWKMQGSYGRIANGLIEAGILDSNGEIL